MAKEKGRFRAFLRDKGKPLLVALTNPRFLLCFGLAWMITNGWSYVFLGIGAFYGIDWMTAVGASYLAFLWLPVTPEKIITIAVAVFFLKRLFPKDEKTLAYLVSLREGIKRRVRARKEKKSEKNEEENKRDTE